MKKRLKWGITLILIMTCSALFLTGCGTGTEKDTEGAEKTMPTLSFGAVSSIDSLPMVIAEEKGFFKDYGVIVDLKLFTSAKDRDVALEGGALDGLIADSVALSIYENAEKNMKIVSTTTGNFSVVVNKNSTIDTLKALKGKRMAISENTMMDYLSDYVAKEAGFSPSDLKKVAIPAIPARLEAMNSDQVDAAILPAPFDLISKEKGHKTLETLSNKELEISHILFNSKTNKESIKAFLKAYNQGVDYLNTHDVSEYEDILIEKVGYPKESKGSIELPKFNKATLPEAKNVQAVFDWSYDKGIVKKKIEAKPLLLMIK